MKKLFLVALTAASCTAIIFSCTKKSSDPSGVYTCYCTYTASGVTVTNVASYTSASSELKSTAQSHCNTIAASLTTAGSTAVSCHL